MKGDRYGHLKDSMRSRHSTHAVLHELDMLGLYVKMLR